MVLQLVSPELKPCNIIIIIYKHRHFYLQTVAVVKLSIDTVYQSGLTKFSLHCKQRVMDVYYVTIETCMDVIITPQ